MYDKVKWDDIIIRYLSGACSPEEKYELDSWIEESDENEVYFNNLKYTWIASIQLKPVSNEKIEETTNIFRSKISEKTDIQRNPHVVVASPNFKIFSWVIFRYAAIVLTAFFLGGISHYALNKRSVLSLSRSGKYFYFESPRGSRAIATLPDGSKVWLNASSKISYSLDFNVQERVIQLEGEAYFDVTTNPLKPFIVKASNIDIKAFGTMFNVKAYPEENQVITTLVEGKVTIEGIDESNKPYSIKMAPNQCVTYSTVNKSIAETEKTTEQSGKNSSAETSEVAPAVLPDLSIVRKTLPEPEINTSWKDERWIIANENLQNLTVMLERRFNVNIKLLNEELKEYNFTGIIRNETIEQVMNILSLTMPVKYSIERNNIELELNKELKNRYINALKTNNK